MTSDPLSRQTPGGKPAIIALIPARQGSKGIPRKNLRPLGGKPLVAHSIEHARNTPSVSRVVVSTDGDEIAAVARQYGAEVIRRPEEISGDMASSESALLHALDSLRETEGYEPDLVVFLQATSPLRHSADIAKAIQTLQDQDADSLLSVRPLEGLVWRCGKDGSLAAVGYDPTRRPRRQDMDAHYVLENGSIYVFKPWVLRKFQNRLGGKIAIHVMDPLDSFQVDELPDLELMEALKGVKRAEKGTVDLSRIRLLVLDFDGVLTDNRVLVDQEGREAVWCHRGDGWGIARLKERGIEIIVISTEANAVVAARCRKLGIACTHDCADKLTALREYADGRGYPAEAVAYVGNDVNDLDCLRWVGLPIAVADAEPEVLGIARLVTSRRGGRGAVREVTDWLLSGVSPVRNP